MRVLLAQRDSEFVDRILPIMRDEGLLCDLADSGAELIDKAAANDYDIMLIGMIFDDLDGIEVCRAVRESGDGTPIMVISSLDDSREKVAVLDAGADDYLTKPVEVPELLAHMRAMVRRCQANDSHCLEYADVALDLANRHVERAKKAVILTPREFALLEFLIRNRERVVSRASIGEQVWGSELDDTSSNVIDVYVARLRKKLDRPFASRLIHTVPGIGYRLSSDGDGR